MPNAPNQPGESTFNGEIAIHFSGLEGLDKPIVWVFLKLLVCLNCGCTDFAIPEAELRRLVESDAVSKRAVREIGPFILSHAKFMRPRVHHYPPEFHY